MGFWEVGFAPVTTSPDRDVRDWRRRVRQDARRSSASSPPSFSRRRRGPPSRLLEREGHAGRDPQGREQGVSRAARASGCSACRPTATSRCATASPARTRTSSARCATASIARRRRRSSSSITSRTRPTAARAGRGRSARAAATTRRTRATATTTHANLHYCDWIRGWTDTCLQIYGELSRTQSGVPRAVRRRRQHEGAECHEPPQGDQSRRPARVERRDRGSDVVALQRTAAAAAAAAALSARLLARVLARAGKPTAPAAPPGCASRSSATCSTATSAASGPRRCPIS